MNISLVVSVSVYAANVFLNKKRFKFLSVLVPTLGLLCEPLQWEADTANWKSVL